MRILSLLLIPVLIIIGLIYALGNSLGVLALAFFAVYLSSPGIRFLEKRKIPRWVAVSFIFITSSISFVLLAMFLIPKAIRQIQDLSLALPHMITTLDIKLNQWLTDNEIPFQIPLANFRDYAFEHVGDWSQEIFKSLFTSAKFIFSGTIGALVWVLNFALFPIFFFYVTLDYEKILNFLHSLFPMEVRPKLDHYLKKFDDILSGFIRGQLSLCFVTSILYGTGYHFAGVPYGFVIGAIAGLFSFIPYVGTGFGLIVSVIVTLGLGGEWTTILWALIAFAIVQGLESYVLSPKLIGGRVGLNSLESILAIIAGANLFGFWGIMIAIPITAMFKVAIGDYVQHQRQV